MAFFLSLPPSSFFFFPLVYVCVHMFLCMCESQRIVLVLQAPPLGFGDKDLLLVLVGLNCWPVSLGVLLLPPPPCWDYNHVINTWLLFNVDSGVWI